MNNRVDVSINELHKEIQSMNAEIQKQKMSINESKSKAILILTPNLSTKELIDEEQKRIDELAVKADILEREGLDLFDRCEALRVRISLHFEVLKHEKVSISEETSRLLHLNEVEIEGITELGYIIGEARSNLAAAVAKSALAQPSIKPSSSTTSSIMQKTSIPAADLVDDDQSGLKIPELEPELKSETRSERNNFSWCTFLACLACGCIPGVLYWYHHSSNSAAPKVSSGKNAAADSYTIMIDENSNDLRDDSRPVKFKGREHRRGAIIPALEESLLTQEKSRSNHRMGR